MINIMSSVANLLAESYEISFNSDGRALYYIVASIFAAVFIFSTVFNIVKRVKGKGRGGSDHRNVYKDGENFREQNGIGPTVVFDDIDAQDDTNNTAQSKAKFCIYCGEPVTENAKFCENCGARITEE